MKNMAIISSNALFHFTDCWDTLINILKNEFYPRYSLEKIAVPNKSPVYRAIPMVCFCDIPLSQIKNHISTYGSYGLGMSKRWAERNGLNPVFYLKEESLASMHLKSALIKVHDMATNSPDTKVDDLGQAIKELVRYTKPYEGTLSRKGRKNKNVKFYDEREWRYVPHPKIYQGNLFLNKEEYDNNAFLKEANENLKRAKLRFKPDDIKYVIVNKEKEILDMVNELRSIKGGKYPLHRIEILTSRIITCEQILNDF